LEYIYIYIYIYIYVYCSDDDDNDDDDDDNLLPLLLDSRVSLNALCDTHGSFSYRDTAPRGLMVAVTTFRTSKGRRYIKNLLVKRHLRWSSLLGAESILVLVMRQTSLLPPRPPPSAYPLPSSLCIHVIASRYISQIVLAIFSVQRCRPFDGYEENQGTPRKGKGCAEERRFKLTSFKRGVRHRFHEDCNG
jgi:hypothetical protein